jgi:hypothetical protein
MQFNIFQQSITADQPPQNISVYLQAMWYDAHGNWDKAHQLVNDLDDATASRVHAYLHRKEGDSANAGYWYRRAGKEMPVHSLEEEWILIVKELL